MAFTIESAKQVLDDYYDLVHPKYEDDIQFIHALDFLIQETNNPEYMVELGGWYYGQKQFDLAEDYYLMAAKLNYADAYECLGYIYYYGRVGQPDYEKAFHYYKLASDQGNIVAAYKLADMYKNTKETELFIKNRTLYNINNLKKEKNMNGISSIIMVEGYMDWK